MAVVEPLHKQPRSLRQPVQHHSPRIHAESPRGFPGPVVVFYPRARVAEAGSSDQLRATKGFAPEAVSEQ